MSPGSILGYLGSVSEHAMAATIVVLAMTALLRRRMPHPTFAVLVLVTGFVIFLALYPFPERGTVECVPPILNPLDVTEAYVRLWRVDAPLSRWLTNLGTITPVANFAFFAAVGLVLAAQTRRWAIAAAYGAAVSGFMETAQVTGLFGYYACAYRTFETADLILNIGGLLAGFGVGRLMDRHGGPPAG